VASLFAEAGYQVTGVDISASAVDWARDSFAARGSLSTATAFTASSAKPAAGRWLR
jgi:hypothetical protein